MGELAEASALPDSDEAALKTKLGALDSIKIPSRELFEHASSIGYERGVAGKDSDGGQALDAITNTLNVPLTAELRAHLNELCIGFDKASEPVREIVRRHFDLGDVMPLGSAAVVILASGVLCAVQYSASNTAKNNYILSPVGQPYVDEIDDDSDDSNPSNDIEGEDVEGPKANLRDLGQLSASNTISGEVAKEILGSEDVVDMSQADLDLLTASAINQSVASKYANVRSWEDLQGTWQDGHAALVALKEIVGSWGIVGEDGKKRSGYEAVMQSIEASGATRISDALAFVAKDPNFGRDGEETACKFSMQIAELKDARIAKNPNGTQGKIDGNKVSAVVAQLIDVELPAPAPFTYRPVFKNGVREIEDTSERSFGPVCEGGLNTDCVQGQNGQVVPLVVAPKDDDKDDIELDEPISMPLDGDGFMKVSEDFFDEAFSLLDAPDRDPSSFEDEPADVTAYMVPDDEENDISEFLTPEYEDPTEAPDSFTANPFVRPEPVKAEAVSASYVPEMANEIQVATPIQEAPAPKKGWFDKAKESVSNAVTSKTSAVQNSVKGVLGRFFGRK